MQGRLKVQLSGSRKPLEGSAYLYPDVGEIPCTPTGIIHAINEARKRDFHPNVKIVHELREMGYEDGQIIIALRKAKNSKEVATELLASGRVETSADDEDEKGLDKTSQLYQALSASPHIRLALMNSRIMLAFLSILDGSSPTVANAWLGDPDVAPVLGAIFKIYHAEKHTAAPVST
jgi:hypothetical protein